MFVGIPRSPLACQPRFVPLCDQHPRKAVGPFRDKPGKAAFDNPVIQNDRNSVVVVWVVDSPRSVDVMILRMDLMLLEDHPMVLHDLSWCSLRIWIESVLVLLLFPLLSEFIEIGKHYPIVVFEHPENRIDKELLRGVPFQAADFFVIGSERRAYAD